MTRKTSPPTPSRPTRLAALLGILGLGLTLWGCGSGSDANECAPAQAPSAAAEQARPSPQTPPTPPPIVVRDAGAHAATPVPASLQPPSPPALPPVRAIAKPTPAPKAVAPVKPAPKVVAQPAPAPQAEPLPRLQVNGDFGILEAATAAGVDKRVPVGVSETFDTNVGKVWAYVKVKNKGEPTQIVMVWKKDGVEKFRYDLRVGRSAGWRTWTRKRIGQRDHGAWTVEVLDDAGAKLHTLAFDVAPAPEAVAVDG